MKPFLGIDITDNKDNEHLNAAQFLEVAPSAAMTQALDSSTEKAEQTVERAKLPLALRILQGACLCVGLILAAGILDADVSLAQGYKNAPALYWIAIGCLLMWGVLKLLSMKKEKTVMETDEAKLAISNAETACSSVFAELRVPADAQEVDLLFFFYKVKDGQVKVKEKGFQICPYFNLPFKLFTDEENLYLANAEGKYAIPRSALGSIQTVKKHIRMNGWNKETPPNTGRYKPYKLTSDDYGCVHCKAYHILSFTHEGEEWGIYFPSYELPAFEEIN